MPLVLWETQPKAVQVLSFAFEDSKEMRAGKQEPATDVICGRYIAVKVQ